jgi:hypothetical protein
MGSSTPNRPVQNMPDLEGSILHYPLQWIGIGFLAGFVVGGGQRSRLGQALIGFAARVAVRTATMSALSRALRQS